MAGSECDGSQPACLLVLLSCSKVVHPFARRDSPGVLWLLCACHKGAREVYEVDGIHIVLLLEQEDDISVEAHPSALPLDADALCVADDRALEVRVGAAEGPEEEGCVLRGTKVDFVHVEEALLPAHTLPVHVRPEGADVLQVVVRSIVVDPPRQDLCVPPRHGLVCLRYVNLCVDVPPDAHLFGAAHEGVLLRIAVFFFLSRK